MVPLLDTNNLYTKLHHVSCLSNILFTWTHKTELIPVFIHMTGMTLHKMQCGMYFIKESKMALDFSSLMLLLFLLTQGGCVMGPVHWRARVMEDMVVKAYILHL